MGVERVITSGTFSLDGEDFAVDNNIWLVGDDAEVVVIDAAHDHEPILAAVAGRRVVAIVATHGHNDHINAAPALADAELWGQAHPDRRWDADLAEGQRLSVGGHELVVLHTPGHTPGGVCLWDERAGVVFSADTLFNGGPGATGRSFSSFPDIVDSIRTKLLTLPAHTVVHTGHGDSTTIAAEAPNVPDIPPS